ncbi:EcsC family protein [Rhodospirillales bacterium]|nr:EcsC family protein [Rhodospirillales bacterium]
MTSTQVGHVFEMNNQDIQELKKAILILEAPSLMVRMSNVLGTPIEKGMEKLPNDWQESIGDVVELSLNKAMEAALLTMSDNEQQISSDWLHKGMAVASGAAGGVFGLSGLLFELPITTAIILRSITDIARSEGEDIHSPEVAMSCMEVFALGSPKTKSDDAAEASYYAIRATLGKVVADSATYLATKTSQVATSKLVNKQSAPVLVRFIEKIAERFGITVTSKAAAQFVPVIGAIAGASINAIFINHYQDMARGHFVVLRLERTYGENAVKLKYEELRSEKKSLSIKKPRSKKIEIHFAQVKSRRFLG